MRILDGYHTRISGDAETEEKLKKALKAASKVIKTRIFEEENRPIFEEAFQSVLPDWKYNSSNIGDISGWIDSTNISSANMSFLLFTEKYILLNNVNWSSKQNLRQLAKYRIKLSPST